MVQIKQCCFCISLRTAAVIIGVLDLIGSFIYVALITTSFFNTSVRHSISSRLLNIDDQTPGKCLQDFIDCQLAENRINEDEPITAISTFAGSCEDIFKICNSAPPSTAYKVISSIDLGVYILHIIFSCLLIVGARQRKAAFTVPWLVLNIVGLVLFTIACIISLFNAPEKNHLKSVFTGLLLVLPVYVYSIYLVLVVHSFYCSIKKQIAFDRLIQ